jgi:hypothetical protein
MPATPTPPPDAALPGGIERALTVVQRVYGCSDPSKCGFHREQHEAMETLRTHIAALTAQNAALVAERDALRGEVRDVTAHRDCQREKVAYLAKNEENAKRDARIEALEWVLQAEGDKDFLAFHLRAAIRAEITRLKAQGE